MAARSVWKGYIRFSLVSVPVKAYTANNSGAASISLNQLHAACNSRINYKKVCPIHGEVKQEEIVSGYQFADDQYVIINPDEMEKLRTPKDKSIDIGAFIKADALDPMYYSEKTHYLVPDGPVGFKPYALLHRVMVEQDRHAFAQVVFSGKEQVVVLRPMGGLIAMTALRYDAEVRKPAEFEGEVPKIEISPDEIKLAKTLTEAMTTDDFQFASYHDQYTERLRKLIEAKVAGQEIVPAAAEEPPMVINLMEALQKSVAAAKSAATKPPKLVASSAEVKTKESRRRKTS